MFCLWPDASSRQKKISPRRESRCIAQLVLPPFHREQISQKGGKQKQLANRVSGCAVFTRRERLRVLLFVRVTTERCIRCKLKACSRSGVLALLIAVSTTQQSK